MPRNVWVGQWELDKIEEGVVLLLVLGISHSFVESDTVWIKQQLL